MDKAWMGLTKSEDNCEADDAECRVHGWQWQDGSPYDIPGWHDWKGSYEPSNTDLCAVVYRLKDGLLGVPCNGRYYHICEKGVYISLYKTKLRFS